ncbi:phage holin family protein [Planosporangium sp. 12N6]|uniref:phage holin family protein n=1 Tax=Planosporangium spinosum TaxID=3402278 RepID=UPI003CF61340
MTAPYPRRSETLDTQPLHTEHLHTEHPRTEHPRTEHLHTEHLHTEPKGTSIGQLIADISDDLSRLFRQEVELAKAELRQEAVKAGKAAGMLGGAGVAGYMVALFLTLAVMFGLGNVMDLGWAALIVAVVWAAAGAVLYLNGRRRLSTVSPMPRQTVETIKEDARWLKNPTG